MASRTFLGETRSIRAARQFVHEIVDGTGIDPLAATLLTSELATNVVKHACTDFDVVVTINDAVVRVEIHDGIAVSEAFRDVINNPPTEVKGTAPGGRGLLLLGATSTRFGLPDKGPEGKAIWFEIQRTPADRSES